MSNTRRKLKSRKQQCGNCQWWSQSAWPHWGECGHPITRMVDILASLNKVPQVLQLEHGFMVKRTDGKQCACFERVG